MLTPEELVEVMSDLEFLVSRHGIAPRSKAGLIEIRAEKQSNRLQLQVQDNGPGLPNGGRGARVEGVGLTNTRERLRQLYGDEQSFTLRNGPDGGTLASLIIPMRFAES